MGKDYSFLSPPSELSFLSLESLSPQSLQLPARPEFRETTEVTRPNWAIRMNLFIRAL